MPKSRHRPSWIRRVLGAALPFFGRVVRSCVRILPVRHSTPVEVLVADAVQRRAIEREIVRSLKQLRRVLGSEFPRELAVVVQQTIGSEPHLAGSYVRRHGADGTDHALVRLSLYRDGQPRPIDEVLAALADACLGLAQWSCQPGVLVPLDAPLRPQPRVVAAPFGPDPLVPPTNGNPAQARFRG